MRANRPTGPLSFTEIYGVNRRESIQVEAGEFSMRAPAKKEPTFDPTVAYLHAHGIRVSPSKLDEMVREAVVRLRAAEQVAQLAEQL